MAFTGDKLTAMSTTSTTESAGGSSGSTVYVAVGATCGVTFVAPASGAVVIHFGSAGFNSGANDNRTTVEVRLGITIGSGTVFLAAIDNNGVLFTGSVTYRIGSFVTVPGLTPGSTYNAQVLHRTSAGTGSWVQRSLTVCPQV